MLCEPGNEARGLENKLAMRSMQIPTESCSFQALLSASQAPGWSLWVIFLSILEAALSLEEAKHSKRPLLQQKGLIVSWVAACH